jgi:hypothetical protein
MPRPNLLLINRFSTSTIFWFISVVSLVFYLSHFFIMFFPQFFGSSASDSATQSGAPADSLILVIHDVIRGLEDDPTQKELHAEASQAEERHVVIAQDNVTSVVAQQDVTKQPVTYKRKAKKQKQVCMCIVIILSVIHFYS